MKQFLFGASISFAFMLGCAAAVVATDLAVPPARSASVQKWEYSCKRASEGVTDMANAMGKEGWELAASAAHHRETEYPVSTTPGRDRRRGPTGAILPIADVG